MHESISGDFILLQHLKQAYCPITPVFWLPVI